MGMPSDTSDALREWQDLSRVLGREAFVARFRHPFLLMRQASPARRPAAPEHGDVTDRFEFDTGVREPVVASATASPVRLVGGRIWPLVKGAQSPYRDYITVGRANNCDVVLLDPSVSKLHAYFCEPGPDQAVLVDHGSKNGTHVNGGRLDARSRRTVVSGDVLVFGHVAAQFLGADRLFRLL
jgi:hypothetical protein